MTADVPDIRDASTCHVSREFVDEAVRAAFLQGAALGTITLDEFRELQRTWAALPADLPRGAKLALLDATVTHWLRIMANRAEAILEDLRIQAIS